MIDQETIRKLREMNLNEFIEILEVQEKDSGILTLPFDERLKMAVDHVYMTKRNTKIARLINHAKLRFPKAEVTSIIFDKRSIERSVITELSTCSYIKNATNIIIQGYTGSGKTYLACAFGKSACYKTYRVKYIRLPDLLMAFEESKLTSVNYYKKFLEKYERYDLLIIDEWLMQNISTEEQFFLFELIERRYGNSSTIFSTQYNKDEWLNILGVNVHSEAIVDRIIHNSVVIETGETNMRQILKC